MTQRRQKLERTWLDKENQSRLEPCRRAHVEPRILLEDPSRSYHASHRVHKNDHFDNRLSFGDNLLAVKALKGNHDEA